MHDRARSAGRVASSRLVLASAGVAVLAVTAGCVSPAIDEQGYRGKVTHSAQSMVGIVGTARLAAQLDMRGRLTEAVRDTVISDAENDAQSVLTAFEVVQPPDHAMIALRSKADNVLQQAASDITDLRIATRASDWSAAQQSLKSLQKDLADLQQLQDRA